MKIYNTMTRQKEEFKTIEPGKVRMYLCGPTVYNYIHVGNARSTVAFDTVRRYLEYKGYEVNYVSNFTDVDDRIINQAIEEGVSTKEIADKYIDAFTEDTGKLNVKPACVHPRVIDHIEEIIEFVEALIEKGFAYESQGDVYYRARKFKNYGQLSNKSLDELEVGASQRTGSEQDKKEDPLDFALWKAAKEGEVSWNSPWGAGRPGWHIECSVMVNKHLGTTIDIHAGGQDLEFPHHENEIAQSEAATGKHYATTWMHAGAVRVDGEKMSKSLGNFFTIRDVLEKYHPEVVRYLLVSSHYRSPINYSEDNLREARSALERFYLTLKGIESIPAAGGESYVDRFTKAMDDDFNAPEACSVLFEMAREVNRVDKQDPQAAAGLAARMKELAAVLGILQLEPDTFLQAGSEKRVDAAQVEALIAARLAARENKNWAQSDRIRDELTALGIVLEDGKDGTGWRFADQ